jgi:tetratricopeptide (TPR) repeat protein
LGCWISPATDRNALPESTVTPFEEMERRRELDAIVKLAWDAQDEGHFATMDRLMNQAVAVAEQMDDLAALVQARFYQACAWAFLDEDGARRAVNMYLWIIAQSTDPHVGRQLADEESQKYVYRSYTLAVGSGASVSELPVRDLYRLLNDAGAWLNSIGKPHWAGSIHSERARLLSAQGDYLGARRERERALALKRRHPDAPGYWLSSHLTLLADLLAYPELAEYAGSLRLADEVLDDPSTPRGALVGAYCARAVAQLGLGELEAAEAAAREAIDIAPGYEDPFFTSKAYRTLGRVLRRRGRTAELVTATVTAWRWARAEGGRGLLIDTLTDCAACRICQAREALGLPAESEVLPTRVPAEADRPLAMRRLRSATRLLRKATKLAEQHDRQFEGHRERDRLQPLFDTLQAVLAMTQMCSDGQ